MERLTVSEMLLSTCLNAELLYQQRKAAFSSLLAQMNRLLKFRKGSQDNMNSNEYFTQEKPHTIFCLAQQFTHPTQPRRRGSLEFTSLSFLENIWARFI